MRKDLADCNFFCTFATANETRPISKWDFRKDGRVVDCDGLENR